MFKDITSFIGIISGIGLLISFFGKHEWAFLENYQTSTIKKAISGIWVLTAVAFLAMFTIGWAIKPNGQISISIFQNIQFIIAICFSVYFFHSVKKIKFVSIEFLLLIYTFIFASMNIIYGWNLLENIIVIIIVTLVIVSYIKAINEKISSKMKNLDIFRIFVSIVLVVGIVISGSVLIITLLDSTGLYNFYTIENTDISEFLISIMYSILIAVFMLYILLNKNSNRMMNKYVIKKDNKYYSIEYVAADFVVTKRFERTDLFRNNEISTIKGPISIVSKSEFYSGELIEIESLFIENENQSGDAISEKH